MHQISNQLKKEILDCIKKKEGAFFGDIVKQLDYSAYTIMRNLIDLKKRGLVFKDNDGGQFKLK
jgi:predicted transcriptional regulator